MITTWKQPDQHKNLYNISWETKPRFMGIFNIYIILDDAIYSKFIWWCRSVKLFIIIIIIRGLQYLDLPLKLPDRKHEKQPKFSWVCCTFGCETVVCICTEAEKTPSLKYVFKKGQSDSHDRLIHVMGRECWVLPEEGKIACHCLFEANLFLQSSQYFNSWIH